MTLDNSAPHGWDTNMITLCSLGDSDYYKMGCRLHVFVRASKTAKDGVSGLGCCCSYGTIAESSIECAIRSQAFHHDIDEAANLGAGVAPLAVQDMNR